MADLHELNSTQSDSSLVYTVDLSSHNLKEVPKSLSNYKNCKSIDISCNKIKSIKDNDLSTCSQLKELKMYANQLLKINGLQKLRRLEEVQLQFNNISAIGNSLKQTKHLKLLRLDSNKIGSIKADEICSLNNLTYIDVSSNKLENINCFNVLTSLEELHCTHNMLTKMSDFHSLKKLREVDLSYNLLTDISGLKASPNLKVLTLEHNKLSNLTSVGCLKSLQDLKVCHNKISNLKHLTDQFPNLEILHVSCNKISLVSEIEHILVLSKNLRELLLFGNPVAMEYKQEVMTILNQMNLGLLDKVHLNKSNEKGVLPTAMRPMSANQMVSTRLIEDQMTYSEMCVYDFEDKIKSQFAVVNALLTDLPATRPKSSLPVKKSASIATIPSSSTSKSASSSTSRSASSSTSKSASSSTSKSASSSTSRSAGSSTSKSASSSTSRSASFSAIRPVSSSLTNSRSTSRCNSRTRIEEAKAFAAQNL